MDSAREAVARVQGHLKSHRPSAVEAWEALSNIQLEFLKRKRLEWLTNRMDDLNVMVMGAFKFIGVEINAACYLNFQNGLMCSSSSIVTADALRAGFARHCQDVLGFTG